MRDPAEATLCDEEKFKNFSDSDSEENVLSSSAAQRNLGRKLLIAPSLIVVLILIVYFTISRRPASSPTWDQCGTTPEEARARGCIFETTGFAWLPKNCLDPDTENEFLDYLDTNSLKIYGHYNSTIEVPIDEVRKGDRGYWVYQQYHLTHCLFLIKKMHRAVTEGKAVDGLIKPFGHTEHCVHQLLLPPELRRDEIQFSYLKFPYCGRPGGYNLQWDKQGQWTDE